ncbi:MAG: hypothetical protein WA666_00845 [Nitrospirota bacterium]
MKKISNLILMVFVVFLLAGCTQKLSREESESKLEKCGLRVAETRSLILAAGEDFGRTEKILDKLAATGFIKMTPMDQWEYGEAIIAARLDTKTNTWTIEPGPRSDEWTVVGYLQYGQIESGSHSGEWEEGSWYEYWAEAKDDSNRERLGVTRYDVGINYPNDGNLGVKDGKLQIITIKDSNFKVTGIMEVSPTLDMVQYTAEETATPEGAAIGAKSSTIEGTMKFMRYDDGWRPVL